VGKKIPVFVSERGLRRRSDSGFACVRLVGKRGAQSSVFEAFEGFGIKMFNAKKEGNPIPFINVLSKKKAKSVVGLKI